LNLAAFKNWKIDGRIDVPGPVVVGPEDALQEQGLKPTKLEWSDKNESSEVNSFFRLCVSLVLRGAGIGGKISQRLFH
jgi:hypothetical protein